MRQKERGARKNIPVRGEKKMKNISSEIIQKAVESLKKNEMEALYFPTAQEAQREILRRIPPQGKVGIGGSLTLRQMGLLEALEKRGNEVFNHWKEGLSKEDRQAVGKKQQRADFS